VLVNPAVDVTELTWRGLGAERRAAAERDGSFVLPSASAPDGRGYATQTRLITEARAHLLFTDVAGLAARGDPPALTAAGAAVPDVPVRVLVGARDEVVPPAVGRALRGALGGRVSVTEVADGDHRLSRDADVAEMCALVRGLLGGAGGRGAPGGGGGPALQSPGAT